MSGRRKTAAGAGGVLLRGAVSVGLLAALAGALDVGRVVSGLVDLRVGWVVLAVGISVLQVAVSAWRWRYTARRLGLRLPFPVALREYYLATFLNQVLPGGVAGDVGRAWRHARDGSGGGGSGGAAVRAVILERASGQVVMTGAAVLSVLALPAVAGSGWARPVLATAGLAAGAGLTVMLALRLRRPPPGSRLGRLWRDTRAGLLGRRALPVQLASSAVVVASYLATYVVAARAVGITTPTGILLPLVAPVLVTMLVPVTVAGWGLREGAAAVLWGAVGLTPEEGVGVSVAYGLLVLVSSLPGILVLAWAVLEGRTRAGLRGEDAGAEAALSGGPGRRGRRLPDGTGGREAVGPRPASRWDPG